MERSERALRERIVWRGERFPVGVSGPPGLHLLVEEGRWVDTQLSLSRAFLQLVPVRLFGTGQAAHIDEKKNRGGVPGKMCQGDRRRPQVEATDALVIQLTPCCQSVLAVMLAKAGVSAGFTYYWI